jgi:hypothetical protein
MFFLPLNPGPQKAYSWRGKDGNVCPFGYAAEKDLINK